MKQAPDLNAFAQLVETLNSSLGLQDLDGNRCSRPRNLSRVRRFSQEQHLLPAG